MSDFKVILDKIKEIAVHPNADRLEIARLESSAYQFIIPKDIYKIGDVALYIPLDAIVPDEILAKLGLTGKLASSKHNRCKSIRLRGAISQGLVCTPSTVLTEEQIVLGLEDYAEILGIYKYEEPLSYSAKSAGSLPPEVFKYDIENAENREWMLEELKQVPIYITEKLEGSHFSITRYPDGELKVCSRSQWVKTDSSSWWAVIYEKYDWEGIMLHFSSILGEGIITLRGEIVGNGVQKNIYNLSNLQLRAFEVELNSTPIDSAKFFEAMYLITQTYQLETVPLLARDVDLTEWLEDQSLRDKSHGQSQLHPVLREGIVIKPSQELYIKGQRLFLKQRDPIYLLEW